MVRCLAPALGLMVLLTPATTLAQVNIDQDKSPAQLYAGDCAACHKSVRGLANGRSASALAGFLGEHYTASSREAAAIAAYVLASGGGAAGPAPARVKPEGERTRANAEEPRSREARRPGQPEGKPPYPAARRPEPERRTAVEPGQPGWARGPAERLERGTTRTRGRAKPAEAVSPPPAAPAPAPAPAPEAKTAVAAPPPVQAATPAPQASPASTAEPKTAAPAEPKTAAPAEPSEATPVPRDNIPD